MLHRLHIDYKIRSVPAQLTRKSLLYFLMRYKPIILHKYVKLGKKQYSVGYSNAFFKKQYLSMFKYSLSTQIMPPLKIANAPATIVN